jgi:NAD(P)-dependent dehydrogenase (short-subunit alcohol dehydrogenase family)
MKKHVIIYGATGGIGSETARRLHAEGCSLHLVGRREDPLAALAEDLGAGFTVGDVTDTSLFARAAEEAGSCDGLVYAVGTINLGSLSRLSEKDFISDFRINAAGAALAVQASLRALKRSTSDPSVVLYSSVAAGQGFPMHGSVGMAKAAVSGLTRSLAAELAPRIRVNAVAPSLTRTPLAEGLLSNEKLAENITAAHALKRLGEAGDIAAATVFLLSEKSAWITGQIIGVDGGRSSLRT